MHVLRRCIVEKGSTILLGGGQRCISILRNRGVELDLCLSPGLCGVRDKNMQIPGTVMFNCVGSGIRICVTPGTAILRYTKIKKRAPGEAH